eukprot:TRINITY_DN1952_c0_g7_i1.p1 TRINITY_DN1952_c0_g7~~TRINITY_DN1952_c0_g7_i1.p1  ORF type:complete len:493 (-),score=61.24 TRINITY_DN1952_c0_g7_i1:26-1393(-)
MLLRKIAENNSAASLKCLIPSIRASSSFISLRSFSSSGVSTHKFSSTELIKLEDDFAAHNYHPIPCVFERAKGIYVWDPEGRQYFDFLSAYSAVNQGHCHPKILKALNEQSGKLTLSSRAFYNAVFPKFARYATQYFGFDRILPMNTGAEAVETALKLARKWAYQKKGIKDGEALIVGCNGCFHGRTLGIISLSDDESSRNEFGPYLPGLLRVPYNDLPALETLFNEKGHNIAAFLVEPIQGEAGVIVPSDGYLKGAADLCKKHNILFIADEIQTGLGRTGKMLCVDWENVKPDILVLGKALSGGVLPVSAILANDDVMLCIKPGEHGSTYGGNPLSSAVSIAALEVLVDEQLPQNAERLGQKVRSYLKSLNIPYIKDIRGKGLLNAIEINESVFKQQRKSAWDICVALKEAGLLCKPTHDTIIRLAPPLVITENEVDKCLSIIGSVLTEFKKFI